MIAHFEYVSDNRIHVRIFDVDAPIEYAQELFKKQEPYQGSMVVKLGKKTAKIELATGCFDYKVYKQLRDEMFIKVGLSEVVWQGNGRIQKHNRRKV